MTLKGLYTDISHIRRMVFEEVARIALEDKGYEEFDKIPYNIIDTEQPTYRSSIFKERAIVAARTRLAVGLDYRESQEHKLISDSIKTFLEENKPFYKPLVRVIKFACEKCPTKAHFVTNNCRKCLAHPCSIVCPVDAITIGETQAIIDQEKCINCGRCKEVCPYNAIVDYVRPCADACGVDAIENDEYGRANINQDKCVSCGQCIISCPFGAIADKSMIYQLLTDLKKGVKINAIIAPSFVGQFGPLASSGRIIAALEKLGIEKVREVSFGADYASLEEAELFHEKVPDQKDYLGTSCCPSWTYIADKHVEEAKVNISPSYSPMVVSADSIKKEDPDCKVVFIGPCISKKLEATDSHVVDYVDYVITFEELAAIFVAADIELTKIKKEKKIEDASKYGRGYANAGGVAEAIQTNLKDKYGKEIDIEKADGLADCKKMLTKAAHGKYEGYLLEGMACPGGCVGGPGTLIKTKKAKKEVDKFSNKSPYRTAENNEKLKRYEKD